MSRSACPINSAWQFVKSDRLVIALLLGCATCLIGCDPQSQSARPNGNSPGAASPPSSDVADAETPVRQPPAELGQQQSARNVRPQERFRMGRQVDLAWQAMVAKFGHDQEQVALVKLLDIEKLDVDETIRARMEAVTREHRRLEFEIQTLKGEAAIILAPTKDPEAMAAKLKLGRVVDYDAVLRMVSVAADPKIFPKNQTGIAQDSTHPRYFQVNYQLMRNGPDRTAAAQRLAEADANRCADDKLREQIAHAFRDLVSGAAASLREPAEVGLQGVVTWGGTSRAAFLLKLLDKSTSDSTHPYHHRLNTIIDALGEVGDASAAGALVAQLVRAIETSDDSAREEDNARFHVVRALVKIGPAAEAAVLEIASSGHPEVCLSALEIIDQIGTSKSLETLRRAGRSGNVLVRQAAQDATESIKARLRAARS